MGLRAIPEMEVIFEDMYVGPDMVVMPPSGLKRGFADLMNAYNAQRVGAGTVALGLAQGAYELAVDFAKEREQFDRPIAEFQGLQWMLADMSVKLEAARASPTEPQRAVVPAVQRSRSLHSPPRPRSARPKTRSRL